MIIIRKRTIILGLMVLLFLVGFFSAYRIRCSQVRIGHHHLRLNPFAQIDPQKKYTLRLWEYDLPVQLGEKTYRQYINQLISDFRKEYPNIKVELRWLDLLDGERQLREALDRNRAPDLYCSFGEVPEYYFRRQIPVGPFLSEKEQKIYPESIRKLYSIERVLCSFPRWISADIWLGNRRLLEEAGLDLSKIQAEGWDWEDLLTLYPHLPANTKLVVGRPVNLGYGVYLKRVERNERKKALANIMRLHEMIQVKGENPKLQENPLVEFMQGRSLILAGVRPLIYLYMKEASTQRNLKLPDQVILPAPRLIPGKEVCFVENGIINIYRNRYTKGDDHLMAALRLGQFISTYPDVAPWSRLGVFPTGTQAKLVSELDEVYRRILRLPVLNRQPSLAEGEQLIYKFMNGMATADEFKKGMDF